MAQNTFQVMGLVGADQNSTLRLLRSTHQRPKLPTAHNVQTIGGLVHQQQWCLRSQRKCNRRLLFLPQAHLSKTLLLRHFQHLQILRIARVIKLGVKRRLTALQLQRR